MRRILLLTSFLIACLIAPARAQVPWVNPPAQVAVTVLRAHAHGALQIEEIRFAVPVRGETCQVFGYLCWPREAATQRLPGLLIVHGGGGKADLDSACVWARAGYVTLAIDLPGKGQRREDSRSSGPDMDLENLFRVSSGGLRNYLVYAVAAARCGLSVLSERPQVDAHRLGMVGLSWGGVITLLVNGQDRRLRAAVDVFGAGYLRQGSTWQRQFEAMSDADRKIWDTVIDPSNYLHQQHSPLLMLSGTNDHCFYLPTFQKTAAEVSVPKDFVLLPNGGHDFTVHAREQVLSWLDDHLRGATSWPQAIMMAPMLAADGNPWIRVRVRSRAAPQSVTLLYARDGPRRWTIQRWEAMPASQAEHKGDVSVWIVRVPRALVSPEILCYAMVEDADGRITSTRVHSLLAVETDQPTFALSAPVRNTNHHELPYLMADGSRLNARLVLDARRSVYRPVVAAARRPATASATPRTRVPPPH